MAASLRLEPFRAPLHCEFDDQNRVLAEQADQHDQTNLRVDVVGQSHVCSKKKEPKTPIGSERITASGRMKLSYCPTSTR